MTDTEISNCSSTKCVKQSTVSGRIVPQWEKQDFSTILTTTELEKFDKDLSTKILKTDIENLTNEKRHDQG